MAIEQIFRHMGAPGSTREQAIHLGLVLEALPDAVYWRGDVVDTGKFHDYRGIEHLGDFVVATGHELHLQTGAVDQHGFTQIPKLLWLGEGEYAVPLSQAEELTSVSGNFRAKVDDEDFETFERGRTFEADGGCVYFSQDAPALVVCAYKPVNTFNPKVIGLEERMADAIWHGGLNRNDNMKNIVHLLERQGVPWANQLEFIGTKCNDYTESGHFVRSVDVYFRDVSSRSAVTGVTVGTFRQGGSLMPLEKLEDGSLVPEVVYILGGEIHVKRNGVFVPFRKGGTFRADKDFEYHVPALTAAGRRNKPLYICRKLYPTGA